MTWSRNLDKNAFTAEKTRFKQGLPVEKKALLAIAFISVFLLSAIARTQFIRVATADPLIEERYESPPIVSIHSPANGADVSSVLLNFTVTKPVDWLSTPISFSYSGGLSQKLFSVYFYIDGNFCGSVTPNSNLLSPFSYSLLLTNLTDGSHTLVVRADSTGVVRNWISSTVYSVPIDSVFATANFTLDSAPPNVSFSSVDKTYTMSEFPLDFTLNESVCEISYVLDGQESVTVSGNTTLANLAFGEHNVTVYATDNVGNIGSETITFTIAEPEPEPFPTTLVIAVVITMVVGVGLLVYFKKRKRELGGQRMSKSVALLQVFWLNSKKTRGAAKHE